MDNKALEIKQLSSLAKVFPERICGEEQRCAQVARGTQLSFQVACRCTNVWYVVKDYDIKVISPVAEYVRLYRVGLVPSELAAYPDRFDDNYLTCEAGLFPDPLFPIDDGKFRIRVGKWRTIWVSIDIPEDLPEGKYPVSIEISSEETQESQTVTFDVTVNSAVLPKQKLRFTQWLHCDCIADAHNVEIFSEEHWRLIESYMRLAAEHGMNMILTPVITPALDTAVGAERPTVQLVKITLDENGYTFDFTLLERFVRMAQGCGINDFEISHFFTQWGAAYCPKVIAVVNGEEKRIFGWDTASDSEEYKTFLEALVPQLIAELNRLGVKHEHIWFHVSDEPNKDHMPRYRICEGMIHELIEGCHHMDALSTFNYYKEGLVETPVVATNSKSMGLYVDANIDNLWCYYCCSQCTGVANRFFSMPSARNRIIGVQLYKYGIKGFLHWGYNFYYTQYSKAKIDPFCESDSGGAFPSGDAFSVYPYKNGAIPSLRQKVFMNALEDARLLELLEEKIGKQAVVAEIERIAGMEITFSEYPRDEAFFEKLYTYVFERLKSI